MSEELKPFKDTIINISEYPSNFIPVGGKVFIGVDPASSDRDCTVKGFYKDGIFHVQEMEQKE